MTLRLGSLCTGAGMLDLAAMATLGPCATSWHAEIDPDAAAVLTSHWPDVPNLGDIKTIDWSQVEPVDVLTAGYPCQPFSHAGKRLGDTDDRAIWPHIADALRTLRPRLFLAENVAGHLARGFPRVVRDLAGIGYVGSWMCLRASDIGSPHRRDRLFIAAHPAEAEPPAGTGAGERQSDVGTPLLPTPAARDSKRGRGWTDEPGRPLSETVMRLLPTPTASESAGAGHSGEGSPNLRTAVAMELFPTPNAALGRGAGLPSPELAQGRVDQGRRYLDDAVALLPTPNATDAQGGPRAVPDRRTHSGPDHGPRLRDVAPVLLPTPRGSEGAKGGPNQRGSSGDLTLSSTAFRLSGGGWGRYAPAIHRWETVLGREAPDPTSPGRLGAPRLSALFVEWMMGLPAGWVTDVVPRNAALRILGNGVVHQQAAAAYQALLAHLSRSSPPGERRQPR